MARFAPSVVLVAALSAGAAAAGTCPFGVISANGVQLTVPAGWQRVQATASSISDPRTLLVVGTIGVRPNLRSECQIAADHVPAGGAVVVVVGWKTASSGGGRTRPGRAPLQTLRSVRRPSFECYRGRGAAASLVLRGRAYQVNVLVGDHASKRLVERALAVGRSFTLAR